ncbi:hypothetical protein VNO80_06912 [Phaseolus coccineus]|uniref:Uncharacterized protein n=1 Tax=Phaseolus coccineus TaxID=3886 RepID=A0AAN9RJD8_PHACN
MKCMLRHSEKTNLVKQLNVVGVEGDEEIEVGIGLDKGIMDLRDNDGTVLFHVGDSGGFLDGGRREAFIDEEVSPSLCLHTSGHSLTMKKIEHFSIQKVTGDGQFLFHALTYISNNERIVHLKPQPSINKSKSSDVSPESKSKEPSIRPKSRGKCEECGKHLQDEHNRFCSIIAILQCFHWILKTKVPSFSFLFLGIQEWIKRVAKIPVDGKERPSDVYAIELGGTIGK